jgi:hypothetical protein
MALEVMRGALVLASRNYWGRHISIRLELLILSSEVFWNSSAFRNYTHHVWTRALLENTVLYGNGG